MIRPARLMAGVAVTPAIAVLAACSGVPHPHTAHAEASASAFATSPVIRADEVTALRKLAACSSSATSGQLTFTVTATTKGQASIPGVATSPYPRIHLTHYSFRLLHHLKDKVKAAIDCAAPKGTRTSVKQCAEKLNLPTSKAKISGYLTGIADCTVGAPQ